MKPYFIPNGPLNLSTLFPTVNFHDVEEYSVQIRDNGGVEVAETTKNWVILCVDNVRVFFINYLGTLDAIDFELFTQVHEAKGDSFERLLQPPIAKADHAIERFNIKSNDTFTLISSRYPETDKDWIDELLDSPVAWMQWKGTQGQPDAYLPIVIVDDKREKVKEEDRYVYELTLQFKLSHEKVIIRN